MLSCLLLSKASIKAASVRRPTTEDGLMTLEKVYFLRLIPVISRAGAHHHSTRLGTFSVVWGRKKNTKKYISVFGLEPLI